MDRFDDYTLLELIGQVARLADLEHPERVTQHQFDITAASDQRFTSLPRARNLTRLLHQSWGDLVELSLRDPDSRRRALAARQRAENATWLTREQAIYTLRLACRRLGGQASLTPRRVPPPARPADRPRQTRRRHDQRGAAGRASDRRDLRRLGQRAPSSRPRAARPRRTTATAARTQRRRDPGALL